MRRRPPAPPNGYEHPSRLAEVRYARGLTLRDLTTLTGLSLGHIHTLEMGTKRPRLDTARRLAKALGTTIDDIFPDNQDEEVA